MQRRTAISDTLGDWMIPTGRHVRGSGDEIWRRPEGGKLGEGTYGDVWMEICDSGPPEKARVRAVKVIPQKHLGLTQRELEAMIKCATSSNHPYSKYRHYLVEFMGWFQVQSSTVIAMEFVSHGSLQPYISMGRFSAPEVASITVQIARALQLIHGSNIAHRDLKPLNILVAQTGPSWWIKVADFGIAKSNQGTNLKTHRMGTSQYMAPEVLGADGIDDQAYSTAVDIWSLGYSPKVDPTSHLARREVMDVVSATMAKTPSERPSAGQVLDYYWLQPFASFVDRMFVSFDHVAQDTTIDDPYSDASASNAFTVPAPVPDSRTPSSGEATYKPYTPPSQATSRVQPVSDSRTQSSGERWYKPYIPPPQAKSRVQQRRRDRPCAICLDNLSPETHCLFPGCKRSFDTRGPLNRHLDQVQHHVDLSTHVKVLWDDSSQQWIQREGEEIPHAPKRWPAWNGQLRQWEPLEGEAMAQPQRSNARDSQCVICLEKLSPKTNCLFPGCKRFFDAPGPLNRHVDALRHHVDLSTHAKVQWDERLNEWALREGEKVPHTPKLWSGQLRRWEPR
ncbi:hypothetical protein PG985_011898 [Apiospora marii]|uniref:uncharacterized protein n=1 Tax=Apiospora marii TaxID=335849 RepID=UPI0031318DA7